MFKRMFNIFWEDWNKPHQAAVEMQRLAEAQRYAHEQYVALIERENLRYRSQITILERQINELNSFYEVSQAAVLINIDGVPRLSHKCNQHSEEQPVQQRIITL